MSGNAENCAEGDFEVGGFLGLSLIFGEKGLDIIKNSSAEWRERLKAKGAAGMRHVNGSTFCGAVALGVLRLSAALVAEEQVVCGEKYGS